MDVRPQVFVSSTFVDLEDERAAVNKLLLGLNCFPAGMELFPAGDEDKWDLIKGVINDSDYYLLIVSGKYGSIDPVTDLSYTEMEYDYATSTGKPVMAFVRSNLGDVPSRLTESDPAVAGKLESFKAKVKASKNVGMFDNPEMLIGKVAIALGSMQIKKKPVGWVRGNHALTPELLQELAELRAANAELRAVKSQAAVATSTPIFDDLEDGEDEIQAVVRKSFWHAMAEQSVVRDLPVSMTWNDLFSAVAPQLINEAPDNVVDNSIIEFVIQVADRDFDHEQFEHDWSMTANGVLTPGFINQVKVQFLALGLITQGTAAREPSDFKGYWVLTPVGKSRLMQLGAKRRSAPQGALEPSS